MSLTASIECDFSADFIGTHISTFERFLDGLKNRPCRLLEIGSHEGRSAIWLANHIAIHPESSVETIAIYEKPKLRSNIAIAHCLDKVTFHCRQSALVLPALPLQSYD